MARHAFYPAEWDDNQTMDVLFSPFRENRELNPSSWDGKMKFWKEMILQYSKHNKIAVVNSKTLPMCFERNGKIPVCLDVVFDDLIRLGKIKKVEDFCVGMNSSWLSWTFGLLVKQPMNWAVGNLVKKPLSWTYAKVFGNGDSNQPGIQYVVIDQVKGMSKDVEQRHSQSVKSEVTDCIVGYDQLRHDCRDITEDETSFHVAVLYLCSSNKCKITVTENQEKVLTFARRNAQSPIQSKMVSEADMKIYKLKTAEKQLLGHISQLSQEMEKIRREAKMHLSRGEKIAAKNCLKRKKKTEAWKHNKEEALENIRHMIALIQQADSNKQIMDAYSSGVEAFKDIRQRYGLTTDMIDEVMDNVQEAYDIQTNVDESMSQNPMGDEEVSVEDLERELDELMAGDEASRLPSPPSGDPRQELVDVLCTMKLTDDSGREQGTEGLILPEPPSHMPATPPKPVGFSGADVSLQPNRPRNVNQKDKVPLLG